MKSSTDFSQPAQERAKERESQTANDTTVYFAFPGNLDTPSGGYHYDRRLIDELRKTGTQVHTLSLPDCFPFADHQALDISRQSLGALPDDALVIIDGLAFGALDDLAAVEAERLRLIALCHHPLALESGLDDSQQQALMASEKRALRHVRGVVVTSSHTKQILIEQFEVPGDWIAVAEPGVDRVAFASCDGDPLRLLTVGSLIRRKGHDVLIDTLARLTNLPWSARFVGDSKFDTVWAKSLEEKVESLQLSDRISFTGPMDELLGEYQNADVFVLPSRFEGYGMVFAEALAAGLPVIAAHAGAVPDVVPSSAGILVPIDDLDALTEALWLLLTKSEKRRQLQAGARSAAEKLPSWADCAQRVAQKIDEVQIA